MSAKRPPNAGKGRKPGVPNKTTAAMKEAFRKAFDEMGGVPALVKWGKANRTDFYKLAARLIPHEIVGPGTDGEHLVKSIVHEHYTAPPPRDGG